jgi:hypothetical protein
MMARRTKLQHLQSWIQVAEQVLVGGVWRRGFETAGNGGGRAISLLTAFFSVVHAASNYPQTAWLVSLGPRNV